MKPLHDIELMQHADGELALDELDELALAKIEALGHLREVVRGSAELAADEVPDAKFARMWGEIDKVLDNTRPVAVRAEPHAPEAAEPRGFWRRLGGWLDRHRGHLITGVVSAGAVAAVALIVRGGNDAQVASSGHTFDVQPVSLRSPVEIESMDTPEGTGTVLNLEDEDGHTTVIWVTPADTVEGI
ncbi:MAG: hypothetical protein NT062_34100 [Proteobacteria bacterium]|nr:hypothetical protein [Pseudomonadota bacterium]